MSILSAIILTQNDLLSRGTAEISALPYLPLDGSITLFLSSPLVGEGKGGGIIIGVPSREGKCWRNIYFNVESIKN